MNKWIEQAKITNVKRRKKIIQFDTNMEVLKIFESVSQACNETKIPNANILKVCNGKRKTAGGFAWKFL